MEVRVHDLVHARRVEAGFAEALDERPVLVVPERHLTGLAVADARVDHHDPIAGLDHERLDPHAEPPLAVGELRHQPVVALDALLGG
jgi:hypothetical protein